MLRSLSEVIGYHILATDGIIGNADEFYFDDQMWKVRYLVVSTGSWLSERRVLISPAALDKPNWTYRTLSVKLTKEQVEHSPDVDLAKPVSRQQETKLRDYYQWPIYWGGLGSLLIHPGEVEDQMELPEPHLRSSNEVTGYHIQARDGQVGHVEDFILNDENWLIQFMVVDTRNWLPGKKVLVSPQQIEQVDWARRQVQVDLPREMIKNSLEYDPAQPVNRELAKREYDFLGRPE
jgi:hypothetical protein